MPFWPTDSRGGWPFAIAFVVTLLIFQLLRDRLSPKDLLQNQRGQAYTQQLVEWERDRVMALAKGVASTAAAYVAALIPIVYKGEISANISGLAITGTIVGFFGALVLASEIAAATAEFTRKNLP
jgi:hypothetical protein